jgi:hypothetical protein
MAEWKDFLKVDSPRQDFLARQYVAASIRITRYQKEEDDWRLKRASDAGGDTWESQRRIEVGELAKGLRRNPYIVAAKLRATYHGAEYLLSEFRVLADALRNPDGMPQDHSDGQAVALAPLDQTNRDRVCDLLGIQPEHRKARTPLDLPGGSRTAAELAAHQAAVIAGEIGKLERLQIEQLAGQEAREKSAALEGRATRISPELRLMRRYQAAAQRDYDQWIGELRAEQERAKQAKAGEMANIIAEGIVRRAEERAAAKKAAEANDTTDSQTECPTRPVRPGSGAADILSLMAARAGNTPAGGIPEPTSGTLPISATGPPATMPVARSADRGIAPK